MTSVNYSDNIDARTVAAAGVQPYAIDQNGDVWLLLGLEPSGWCSFVGGRDEGETVIETACREAWEESAGVLGTPDHIKSLILDDPDKYINSPTDTGGMRRTITFFIRIPYSDDVIHIFDGVSHVLADVVSDDSVYREKSELRWFHIDELHQQVRSGRSSLRPIYHETVQRLFFISFHE